uniref:Uncharacterized protein n=1 Tax=Anguilla anguilla TaxID=7936 RepID=A0A0E9WQ88_ANGAN
MAVSLKNSLEIRFLKYVQIVNRGQRKSWRIITVSVGIFIGTTANLICGHLRNGKLQRSTCQEETRTTIQWISSTFLPL